MLNSFEELCITLAAADNSFARVLNPHGGAYIYIYIYIYVCVCVCVCVYVCVCVHLLKMQFFVNACFVEKKMKNLGFKREFFFFGYEQWEGKFVSDKYRIGPKSSRFQALSIVSNHFKG